MSDKKLIKEELKQKSVTNLFDYCYKTGSLFWKINKGSVKIGTKAATKDKRGYSVVRIDKRHYFVHRVVWLYVYGYLPENGIDHINRDKSDNRIENLREVSHSCNMRNTGNRKNNTSGVKGVYWNKTSKKWMSLVCENGQSFYLGQYYDFDNAVCARLAGEQCLNWAGCDSSSPAYKYVKKMIWRL